jgi:hypothetical protein
MVAGKNLRRYLRMVNYVVRKEVISAMPLLPKESQPEKQRDRGILNRQKKIFTEDWKKKIGSSLVGRVVGDDTREKLREGKLADKNPMFGEKPWNAGLTADTDNRVSDYSLKQKDIPCPARSHPNKNKGIRKQESLEIISRNDPVYSNFRKYRNRVAVRTRKTYEQFKEEINPSNFTLGKCGIDGAYQIDHITTVRIGFEQGIAVEEISSKENLQIIPWLDNIKKYDGKGNRKC